MINIIEFCEEVLDIDLHDYQKEMLRKLDKADKNNKRIIYSGGRFCGKAYMGKIIDEYKRLKGGD